MKTKIEDQNYSKPIPTAIDGNSLLINKLKSDQIFFAGRSGGTECEIVQTIYRYKEKVPHYVKERAFKVAGIYPLTDDNYEKFVDTYIAGIKTLDIVGVWGVVGYDWLVDTFCPQADYIRLVSLEPYYFPDNPWSAFLQDKKILVIHPFANSIQNNFLQRENLFRDTKILPNFSLTTLKAEQNYSRQADWFESLDKMKNEILNIDFDIAIIGCGAFGLPLGSFIKESVKKTAIHLGGPVQILFGVMGKRWETNSGIMRFHNEYWTRPLPEETPESYMSVEKGCYW
jgi:hypothetical protein